MDNHFGVNQYGLPVDALGMETPLELFEIIGRILAVHTQIGYLKDRLDHLPSVETESIRKVEQFRRRCKSGQSDHDAIVHSLWPFGATKDNPRQILGVGYRIRKGVSGSIASVAKPGVPGSEKEQDYVQHTPD